MKTEPKSFKPTTDNQAAFLDTLESASEERLLTRREAAAFLRKSTRTIDYYVAMARNRKRVNKTFRGRKATGPVIVRSSRQKLPFIKMGGEVLFMLGDLRRFRDERKVAA